MEENRRNQSWWNLAIVLCGALISVPSLILGGTLVSGMSLPMALFTAFVGYAIIVVIMISQGMQSVDQAKPAVKVAEQVFGKVGSSKVVSLILAISALGWFGIQANVAGIAVQGILAAYSITIPAWICSIIVGIVMVLTAMYGIKFIQKLAWIAVPYLMIIVLYGFWYAFAHENAAQVVAAYHPSTSISFVNGLVTTVGSFALGAVIVGDYAQFSTKRSDVIKASIFGIIPAGVVMIGIGAVLTIAFKTADISSLFIKIGTPFIGGLALVLATWKVNVVNAYSGGIAVSNVFNIPEKYRKLTLFAVGVVGTLLAAIGVLNYFTPVMSVLSAMIPPVAGVMGASYWLIHHGDASQWQPTEGVNWLGLSAWLVGALFGGVPTVLAMIPNVWHPTANPIIGIVVALVIYYFGSKFTHQEVPAKEEA